MKSISFRLTIEFMRNEVFQGHNIAIRLIWMQCIIKAIERVVAKLLLISLTNHIYFYFKRICFLSATLMVL